MVHQGLIVLLLAGLSFFRWLSRNEIERYCRDGFLLDGGILRNAQPRQANGHYSHGDE